MKLQDWMTKTQVRNHVVAKDLRVSESHVSDLAKGRKKPSLLLAAEIEDYTCGAVTMRSWVPKKKQVAA